jgi:hypothetical protein
MSSVISAVLVYLTSWSSQAMQLEVLALRHQLAVYQHRVSGRSSSRQIDSWGAGSLVYGLGGNRLSHSCSPARSSPGSTNGSETPGDA